MNLQDFISKWRAVELTERSASQQHFLDLCEVVGHPKPAEADPTGEWFTFERGATKQGGGRGWADVWKRDFFGWEYKGKHKNLDAAYDQLLKYRESLENPPLLVVCDMGRIVVHTNFTATVNVTHEIPLEEMGAAANLDILRAVFHAPERLRPSATVRSVTTEVAERLGRVAQNLRGRGLEPMEVARFLDRIVFCLFAEDVDLLPNGLFKMIAEESKTPEQFAKYVSLLFREMQTGGEFFFKPIRHFNGSLFAESPVLPLAAAEIEDIRAAARLDWGAVDPSIFGTLFERSLDPSKRAQLGAQYTGREDIETLIEPVVLAPLRAEWAEVRAEVERLLAEERAALAGRAPVVTRRARQARRKALQESAREPRALLRRFHERLAELKVLDPACGSGNFLYVTLQKLKDLEKEVLVFASDTGLGAFIPAVGPQQFYGIEVNPYAFDLAQTTLWIGYLQWIQANGYGWPAEPILSHMENFQNRDAVLDLTNPAAPREPDWPAVDFIVGNPPFLGDKLMRGELGDDYVNKLRSIFAARIPGQSDLVCYWFEKARKHIAEGKAKRAGLLATQGIRGGANREVLKRIKESGDIFYAESDRDWILEGATVHVSIIGFDNGSQAERMLDGKPAIRINADLSATADTTAALRLTANSGISFIGVSMHGPFDLNEEAAVRMLKAGGNPTGRPNSDVVRPILNASELVRRGENRWVVYFSPDMEHASAVMYEQPFEFVREHVKPVRDKNNRKAYRDRWWIHGEARPAMIEAIRGQERFLATPRVGKHRIFVWIAPVFLPSDATVAFAYSEDYHLGVLQSHLHEIWALKLGTQLREKESGFRYTPTTCFETYPFPQLTDERQREEIAAAARALNELRINWLNPPEWTREEMLEFPGNADGPWARYVHEPDARGVGTVRYPRLVPRDDTAARELSKRTLTNLYNQRPAWLEHAHRRLDETVAAAYGLPADLPDEEILARLLTLNLERSSGAKGLGAKVNLS